MNKEDFIEGFEFGTFICEIAVGQRMSVDKMIETLVAVAKNELSLHPSPQEAVDGMEDEYGELPDGVKQFIHRTLSGESRRSEDRLNGERAFLVLDGIVNRNR